MLRQRARLLVTLCVFGPAFAVTSPGPAQTLIQTEHYNFRVMTVAEGFQDPWSMAFLPNGDMLVTERPGRLRIVRDGTLLPDAIEGVPAVRYRGQGGLLDVALHPEFETNNLLYLSFSKPNEDGSLGTTAVIRARYDGVRLNDVEEIFEAKAWSDGGNHFGSRLAFDPEGYLYITVGDRGVNPHSIPLREHPAQNLMNHQGKIIRLHDDGRVPVDNPFVDRADALPEIWSYGHRNPQGLAIDQETGAVWATEHGPQGGDELNLLRPGRNYGWPVIGYGVQYGGSNIHVGTDLEGMEQPVQHWTPSIAVSGLLHYTGDHFLDWRGDLFVGGLSGQQIAHLPLVAVESGFEIGRMERPPLLYGLGRIRDIRQGPDGLIYVALDDRQGGGTTSIIRLERPDSG